MEQARDFVCLPGAELAVKKPPGAPSLQALQPIIINENDKSKLGDVNEDMLSAGPAENEAASAQSTVP